MIEPPKIISTKAQLTAVIHLCIPRTEVRKLMGPGLNEVMDAIAAQGVTAVGPWFTHHLKFAPGIFDFEICVPVNKPIAAVGRVRPGELPAMNVARTVYLGGYEGLTSAWPKLDAWIKSMGHTPREDLLEVYAKGPEADPDPQTWRTELNRPLV